VAIERMPKGAPHPLPVDYQPPGGTAYNVRDGDDWRKLAFRWFLNVEQLIWFNFLTLNPDEVNWYLRRNVGCTKQTKDFKNYVFSSSDKPGIVYSPPSKPIVSHDSIDIFAQDMGSRTDLGRALRSAEQSGAIYDYIGFSLNISDFVLTGLAVSGAELGALGLGLDFLGAATAIVGVGLTLGGPHLAALQQRKQEKMQSGLSHGIVLGAANETKGFIRDQFVRLSTDYATDYPEQRKNFQNMYLFGLLKGLEYGQKLTRTERFLLFKHLEALAKYKPPGDFYMHRFEKPESVRKNYYLDCAAKLLKESTQ
jgi:hypothetical protein